MGAAASSHQQVPRVSSAPPRGRPQPTLLVNGKGKRPSTSSNTWKKRNNGAGVDVASLRKIEERRRRHNRDKSEINGGDTNLVDTDPATLYILNAVKTADGLPEDNATQKLQLLRDCYQYLEQVPPKNFDHLAVLVYQKEGDVYFTQGETESAKTIYSRAIQIAETRVARGEREIYMVLKRYVLAMVGMARIWYEKERETTGFTFAEKDLGIDVSLDESMTSIGSCDSSVFSDASIFSLNQEILKSMAPKPPRRRVGPAVNVVRLLRPAVVKAHHTPEDDFVLRSQMVRELKASPCELLLLRCIEVVEIGHRRQSELLIPALIELAQIYEDLKLYNRSLLLVRRCLGILSVVYDYDHPWIIELRRRADYLMERMDEKMKEHMATKIQATWRMYAEMRQLEEKLGRPVARHVWIPRKDSDSVPGTDFLKDFVNDLPDGTILYGTGDEDGPLGEALREVNGVMQARADSTPSPINSSLHSSRGASPDLREQFILSSPRRPTGMGKGISPSRVSLEKQQDPPIPTAYPVAQQGDRSSVNTIFVPDARVVSTVQDTLTDAQMHDTKHGGMLTIRTTTVTRTITEQEVGSDEETSFEEDEEEVIKEGEPMKERELMGELLEPMEEQDVMTEGREVVVVVKQREVMEEADYDDDDDDAGKEMEPDEESIVVGEEAVEKIVEYNDGSAVVKVKKKHKEIIIENGNSPCELEEESSYEVSPTLIGPTPLQDDNVDGADLTEKRMEGNSLINRRRSSTSESSSVSSIE